MKLTFTLIALCFSVVLNAQKAGTLDSGFGVNGKVLTSSSTGYLDCTAATSQTGDSIIAVGDVSFEGASAEGFFAVRYSSDGSFDTSFGRKGFAFINGTGYGNAVAVQPDNKIIIAGYNFELFGPYFITAARLNSNGSIDTTFGRNGSIQTSAGEECEDLAVQSDGKILFVGGNKSNVVTLRYLSNGEPDISFGNNGSIETSFGPSTYIGSAIAVQPDGKIIIAGDGGGTIVLARFNSDGEYDQEFGNNGKVVSDITPGFDALNDIVLQSDGKIIAVGATATGNFPDTTNTIVLRYMQNGILDKSFNNSGFNIYELPTNGEIKSVALQKNGEIITAGHAFNTGLDDNFLVEKYNSNGTIDSGFGNNGYQITEIDQVDVAEAVMLQQDGKIVLAGSAFNDSILGPSEDRIALCRYNNNINKKQIIIQKIKHYIQTHNDAQATTLNNVSIYPNPAQNILHVEGLSANAKLTVVDFNGNIKLQAVANASSFNLNIASLHAGNYLLKIEINGEVVTKQFVKE